MNTSAMQELEKVQDLRLDRHVERRHRLVGNHQSGPHCEGPGNADALPLPTRELVRGDTPACGNASAAATSTSTTPSGTA